MSYFKIVVKSNHYSSKVLPKIIVFNKILTIVNN